MERLTTEQRVKIVKTFYKSGESTVTTFRALRGDYGRHKRPAERTIAKIVKKFEATGCVSDVIRSVHNRKARSTENIASVSESVAEDPNLSIKQRAQQLGLSYGTLWRIMSDISETVADDAATEIPVKKLKKETNVVEPEKKNAASAKEATTESAKEADTAKKRH